MRIPILNLKPEIDFFWDELNTAVQEVLCSGQFIMGANVRALEEEIASYLGVKYAIGVNSGTDALVIALRAAGIGQGDEVITTPFSFFATAESISLVGALPVFVDIDPQTFNLDPNLIEQAITPRTKGILPVHLFGQAADMDRIMKLAEKHHLKVIEDVAQAFGGEFNGKKLGTLGDAGCYSFYPTKNLGAYGDGGLIVTNNDQIAENARMLRDHGSRRKYYHEQIGYNSRLDEIQAAILRVKLPHIEEWNEGRRRVAGNYNELLKDAAGIITPYEAPYTRHVYHQYTIRITGGNRDRVKEHLADAGIGSVVYYPYPLHQLPVYQDRASGRGLPVVEIISKEVLSLPVWPGLDRNAQKEIVEKIKEITG